MSEPSQRNTFRKPERLCSRKEIDRLFAKGSAITVFPLRLMYISRDELTEIAAKTMFVVPKRNFRKAHDRNLLRRRMREAFRINKNSLYKKLDGSGKCVSMALLFTGRKEENYETIESATVELLRRLEEKF